MSLQQTHYVQPLELTDHLLIEQARAGDRQAFETLVYRYQSRLHRFARRYFNDEQAYDIVQAVLLQFYLSMDKTPGDYFTGWRGTSFKSWLFRVTFNRCIDELRKHRRHPQSFSELEQTSGEEIEILEALLDPTPLPEEYAIQQEMQERLQEAIDGLPPKFRSVVWLRYTQDLTFQEIGYLLHMLPSTAKTYYYRALLRLRKTLTPIPLS